METNEQELDIAYAGEFVKTWLEGAKNPVTPGQVFENLNVLIDGVKYYRDKYTQAQEDHDLLLTRYNSLAGLSAGYLQLIQELRQQNDALLVDSQREFHHKEE